MKRLRCSSSPPLDGTAGQQKRKNECIVLNVIQILHCTHRKYTHAHTHRLPVGGVGVLHVIWLRLAQSQPTGSSRAPARRGGPVSPSTPAARAPLSPAGRERREGRRILPPLRALSPPSSTTFTTPALRPLCAHKHTKETCSRNRPTAAPSSAREICTNARCVVRLCRLRGVHYWHNHYHYCHQWAVRPCCPRHHLTTNSEGASQEKRRKEKE